MKNISRDIQRGDEGKGRKLGTVTSFEDFGAVVLDNGSKLEDLSQGLHKIIQLLRT